MILTRTLLLLVCLTAVPFTEPQDRRSGKELLAEGDKLADQAQYTDALLRYKMAYEKILPDLRGLEFKKPVDPQFMERSSLQEHMKKLVIEDTTEKERTLSNASLKVFGFVPADFNTEEMMLKLYSEEVAGFYDPKRKQMFLIKETEKPKKPGLFARLLGAKEGFDKDEQKTTLSHEMAHALADQHFDLVKLEETAAGDDDRSLALQALVEGEATLVMMIESERAGGGNGKEMLHASPAAMDFSFRLMQGLLPFASGKTFRTAPPIFRESMMFGYLKGMVFLLHLTNDNEWERVNHAFLKPPLSTEQVLHPEKYLQGNDEPIAVELPALGELAGPDWKEVGQNVLGELQISILLRKHWGQKAAAGWGGDRYAVFTGPDGRLAAAWFTTWDTEDDAKEFAGAYSRYMGTKFGMADARAAVPNEPNPPVIADRLRIEQANRVGEVLRRDRDVVVIEGFPEEQTNALAGALLKAEKQPKK